MNLSTRGRRVNNPSQAAYTHKASRVRARRSKSFPGHAPNPNIQQDLFLHLLLEYVTSRACITRGLSQKTGGGMGGCASIVFCSLISSLSLSWFAIRVLMLAGSSAGIERERESRTAARSRMKLGDISVCSPLVHCCCCCCCYSTACRGEIFVGTVRASPLRGAARSLPSIPSLPPPPPLEHDAIARCVGRETITGKFSHGGNEENTTVSANIYR